MAKHTNEQLMEKYKILPKELQEAILSVDTSKAIQEIGKKYGLAIDKMGVLADETSSIMFGFERADDFISNLEKQLGVDKETAIKIGGEVNSAIFAPIRMSLRKIQQDAEQEEIPVKKEEVLMEIERGEKVPDILKGVNAPKSEKEAIFDAKTASGENNQKKEVFRIPKEETKQEQERPPSPYSERDPYREPIK